MSDTIVFWILSKDHNQWVFGWNQVLNKYVAFNTRFGLSSDSAKTFDDQVDLYRLEHWFCGNGWNVDQVNQDVVNEHFGVKSAHTPLDSLFSFFGFAA